MNITVGYPQTNRKADTGKTLKWWPILVDHYTPPLAEDRKEPSLAVTAEKKTQYEVIRCLGRGDEIVSLETTLHARKQWPELPTEITARLLTKKVDGKERQVLSSLIDHNRYPGNAISELYRHRWEIELGYREAKQGRLNSQWTLRIRLPELVRQELWRVLLTYNLVRYQMVRMAFHMRGDYLPYQLRFSGAISYILRLLMALPLASPGKIVIRREIFKGENVR